MTGRVGFVFVIGLLVGFDLIASSMVLMGCP